MIDFGPYKTPFSLQGVPVSSRFVSRPSDTAHLENCFLPRQSHNRRKVFVLHGLGGVGKTQLAVDFARCQQVTFSSVFWLNGRSEDQLKRSIAACVTRIPENQIPGKSRQQAETHSQEGLDAAVATVMEWLGRPDNGAWLLIFDNVDKDYEEGGATGAYDVRQYMPGDHGSILITTRLSQLAQLAQLDSSKRLTKVDSSLGRAIFEKWHGAKLGEFWSVTSSPKLKLILFQDQTETSFLSCWTACRWRWHKPQRIFAKRGSASRRMWTFTNASGMS